MLELLDWKVHINSETSKIRDRISKAEKQQQTEIVDKELKN